MDTGGIFLRTPEASDLLPHAGKWPGAASRARVPMRFINGALDPNSDAHMAKRYKEIVPNHDVVILEQIGHWPQFEPPDRVLRASIDFIGDQ